MDLDAQLKKLNADVAVLKEQVTLLLGVPGLREEAERAALERAEAEGRTPVEQGVQAPEESQQNASDGQVEELQAPAETQAPEEQTQPPQTEPPAPAA